VAADQPHRLRGWTVAITGPTSGVGRSAARRFARLGADVILLARDSQKASVTADDIRDPATGAEIDIVQCDLSSFASVRSAAESVLARHDRIDVLVNNAAVIASERELTEDGYELTFQVNYLSHYLLTQLLRSPLTAAALGRVVTLSSDAHFYTASGLRFDDVNFEKGWTPFRAYAHSKLADVMFAYELADRWAGSGVTSTAMHPGVIATGLGRQGWGSAGVLWDRLVPKTSAERAAEDLVWLGCSPQTEGTSGLYYYRRRPKRSSRSSYDYHARRRLWRVSAQMVGVRDGVDL
jgi:NAD(P)-dependent dehydrogenase (short-subunit alcohol dehydrogenase family)